MTYFQTIDLLLEVDVAIKYFLSDKCRHEYYKIHEIKLN